MKRLSQSASAEDDESSWESARKHCSALDRDSTRHDAAFIIPQAIYGTSFGSSNPKI
jgi:hypothetical protein